jgi:hypothetical protein
MPPGTGLLPRKGSLMLLAVLAVMAVLTVPVARGRLSRLADLRLRAVWVLVGALVAQVVIISVVPGGDADVHRWLHVGTYVAVLVWAIANRALPWRWVLVVGGLCNFTAIVANGGVMPASRAALEAAHRGGVHGFANSAAVAHPHLRFLGDVFATPASLPLHNVFSVGDVLIVLGIFLVLHRVCESYLAYVLARVGNALLGHSLKRWRPTGSHAPSPQSTRKTPPIPIGS